MRNGAYMSIVKHAGLALGAYTSAGLALGVLALVCGCEGVKSASFGPEYITSFRGPSTVKDISDGWNLRLEVVPEFPWYYLSVGIAPSGNALLEQGVCFDLGYCFARSADTSESNIVWPVLKPEIGVWEWGETESMIGVNFGFELGIGYEFRHDHLMLNAGYVWRYKLGFTHGEELHVEAVALQFTWRF